MSHDKMKRSVLMYKDGPFTMPDIGLRVIVTLEGRYWAAYVHQADDLPAHPTVRHENHDVCVFLACAMWAGWEVPDAR